MNDFMELHRGITIVLRRWRLLVLLTVIGAGIGYLISRAQAPVYQATTTILVGESIRSSSVERVEIQISEALIQTYAEIARRQPVMQSVVTALNLRESWQDLRSRVTVSPIENTQLIEITVEANSPDLARAIADEIVYQLILLSPSSSENADNALTNSFNSEQITRLQERIASEQQRLAEIESAISRSNSEVELAVLQQEKITLEGLINDSERNYTELLAFAQPKSDPTQLTAVEPAHSNNRIIRPRTQLNTILGAVLGMVVALGLILLLDVLDDTYKSLKDFSQSEEVNVLGSIRRIRGKKLAGKLIAHLQPHSPITESYRIIRSRIPFKRANHAPRSIMVTSSMPKEGKSLTVANLAVVFAQANYKTVIVDADLRHPVLHELFNVENEVGLGDMLSSQEMKVEDCIQNTSVENLQILSSGGNSLPDPSGQLGSERMEQIITELKDVAEIVLFDSPPVLVFADAIALSRRIDGIILVIEAGKSTRSAIHQTLLDLQNANANMLGSIFNQSPQSDTFSVNKMYMQVRPAPRFARALVKQENQFHDLHDPATPLDENPEISSSGNGRQATKIILSHEIKADQDVDDQEQILTSDLDDADTLINESIETNALESEEAVIDEIQISDPGDQAKPAGEKLELRGSDSEASVKEKETDHDQHKERKQKSKHKELKR